ncbi:MAG: hypothetical protein ACRD88_00135 [Terriglobia bacterium]
MNRMIQAVQNGGTAAAFLSLLALAPGAAQAQFNSNLGNVALNAVVQQSISVSVSAAAVNFNLVAGTGPTAGGPTLTVTTNWSLNPGGGPTLSLYGYFASSTAALTNGAGSNIPSANVLSSVNAGAPVGFTGSGPFGAAGGSRQIFSQGITAANKSGTRNDTLDLFINLTAQPNLPAGSYTGVLSLQAQAL